MSKPDLETLHARVDSREGLATFITALREDLLSHRSSWENPELSSFLEAMSAWVTDMDGYYRNVGEVFDETASWKTLADILHAAKFYE